MKIFIFFATLFFFSVNLYSQNNYVVLGKDWTIDFIIRYEILDEETHMPIKNAKIILTGNYGSYHPKKIFSINTNNEGIGIVLVKTARYFPNGKMEIKANRYKYWQNEVYQHDYLNPVGEQLFAYFDDEKVNQWDYHNGDVSDSKLVRALEDRYYQKVYSPTGFPIYEQTVYLEKIKKYNIDD